MEASIKERTGDRILPSRRWSPGARGYIQIQSAPLYTPGGPPNLRGWPHPPCWHPRETIPPHSPECSLPPTKRHFKEQWQSTEGVGLDPPCVRSGCLLFSKEALGVWGRWTFKEHGHWVLSREEAGPQRRVFPF